MPFGQPGQVEDRTHWQETTYDTRGQRMAAAARYPDGSRCETTYTDTPDGRCAQTILSAPDGTPRGTSRSISDARGRLVASSFCGPDGAWHPTTLPTYTAEGEKVEQLHSDPEGRGIVVHQVEGTDMGFSVPGARRMRTIYAGGRPARVTFERSDGSAASVILLDHDAHGALRRVTQFGPAFRDCGQEGCAVPPRGPMTFLDRVLLWAALKPFLFFGAVAAYARRKDLRQGWRCILYGTPSFETAYAYDAAGKRVEERQFLAGRLAEKKRFSYDAGGRLTEQAIYRADDSLLSRAAFDREIDRHGNWTRETVRCEGGTCAATPQVTERLITYHR